MEYIRRIRVCFDYADDTYLYVHPVDVTADEPIRVVYNKPGINHEFEETIKELWRYAQLNLLDVSVDRDGIYTPSFYRIGTGLFDRYQLTGGMLQGLWQPSGKLFF